MSGVLAARVRLGRAATLLVAVVAALVVPLTPPAGAEPVPGDAGAVPYDFGPSGLAGGGFQNVVAFSPFRDPEGRRPLLLGSDIAGVHRSVDGGRSWTQSTAGLHNREVASLLFSRTIPGTVYAATDVAIFVSTDFGVRWSALPGEVDFDANGVFRLEGRTHPRPTGSLLAQDDEGRLYAATATQGVKRSSDGGATWDRVALAGHHLRSIALDPADPDRLFVASADGGLHLSTDARSEMTVAPVPGTPAVVEELEFVGGRLYVAAGTAGMHRYDGEWHPLTAGLPAGPSWQSITGHVDDAGRHVLLAGCAQPVGGAHTMRSEDGGATWTSVATGTGVVWNKSLYGGGGAWWGSALPWLGPQHPDFVASDLAVDPDDPSRVVLAGRGGAYVGERSASGTAWWPAMTGLMVTVNNMVVADPRLPGRVHVANMDYTFLTSGDHGATFAAAAPVGAQSTGDVIALDPDGPAGVPSRVYLGSSKRYQNAGGGAVHSNPDPVANPKGWTNEGLPVDGDPRALAVGRTASGQRVILVSATGSGLWRKEGSTWTRLTGAVPFPTGGHGSMVWQPGTPVVHAHDATGIWRSAAAGAPGSWVRIGTGAAGIDAVGGLALDPVRPGVLYASAAGLGGVVRVTGADTAARVQQVVLPLAQPGPLAVTPSGELLAVDRGGARLLRSGDPGAGTPSFDSVGGGFFSANNGAVRSLAVGAGYLHTASMSGGVSRAAPVDRAPPTVPGTPVAHGVTQESASLSWAPAVDDVAVVDYEVLRDDAVVGLVPATDRPSFVDAGLAPDTAYSYRVRARDGAGRSGAASEAVLVRTPPVRASVAPTGPDTLQARLTGTGGKQVALAWPAAVDDVGVTGYRVSRDGAPVATVTGTAWTDTAPTPGPHTYAVTAVDADGGVSAGAEAGVLVPAPAAAGLTGTYFDTASFTTQRVVRVDPTVNFSWGTGGPASTVAPDTFTVRWTGRVVVPSAGPWTFITASDEAVRLWVAGQLVVDNWTPHALVENRGTVQLTADRAHDVRIEFQERTGSATMRLLWTGPGVGRQVVPSARLLAG